MDAFATEKRASRSWLWICVAILLLWGGCKAAKIALRMAFNDAMTSLDNQPWTEREIPLPDASWRLAFLERPSGFAPFEREKRLRFSGQTRREVEYDLPFLERSFEFEAYWYEPFGKDGPLVRLAGEEAEYVADLGEGKLYCVTREFEKVKLHAVPEDHATVSTEDARASLIEQRLRQSGEYFGRLDGSQWPLQFIKAEGPPGNTTDSR